MVKAERFIITTPTPPSLFYPSKDQESDDVRQLLRRITRVVQFTRRYASDGSIEYVTSDESEIFGVGEYFK